MEWFYEIRDSNNTVAATGKGFATQNAAMVAGRKKARQLKAAGSLPGGGTAIFSGILAVITVTAVCLDWRFPTVATRKQFSIQNDIVLH